MAKALGISLAAFILTTILSTLTHASTDPSFLNTIFTVATVMFSIGMGIICTINLETVKNKAYLRELRANILDVRNSYLAYFSGISIGYLIIQIWPQISFSFSLHDFRFAFNGSLFVAILISLSIAYFVVNFLAIQKLVSDIVDRARREE